VAGGLIINIENGLPVFVINIENSLPVFTPRWKTYATPGGGRPLKP
jgi:hypothetical protein